MAFRKVRTMIERCAHPVWSGSSPHYRYQLLKTVVVGANAGNDGGWEMAKNCSACVFKQLPSLSAAEVLF